MLYIELTGALVKEEFKHKLNSLNVTVKGFFIPETISVSLQIGIQIL
jgi:hypothetical protein